VSVFCAALARACAPGCPDPLTECSYALCEITNQYVFDISLRASLRHIVGSRHSCRAGDLERCSSTLASL
jgi:hypothetical protein